MLMVKQIREICEMIWWQEQVHDAGLREPFVQVHNCGNTWLDNKKSWLSLCVASFLSPPEYNGFFCHSSPRNDKILWLSSRNYLCLTLTWPCHNCKQNCGNTWEQEKLYGLRDLLDNGFSCYSSPREDKVQSAVIMSEFYISWPWGCHQHGAGVSEVGLAWSVSGLWMSATGQPTLNTDNHLNMTQCQHFSGRKAEIYGLVYIHISKLFGQSGNFRAGSCNMQAQVMFRMPGISIQQVATPR